MAEEGTSLPTEEGMDLACARKEGMLWMLGSPMGNWGFPWLFLFRLLRPFRAWLYVRNV